MTRRLFMPRPSARRTSGRPDVRLRRCVALMSLWYAPLVAILVTAHRVSVRDWPAWLAYCIPVAVVLGLIAVHRVFAEERRVESRTIEGRCLACGYDLRATPERCPECGRVPHGPARAV